MFIYRETMLPVNMINHTASHAHILIPLRTFFFLPKSVTLKVQNPDVTLRQPLTVCSSLSPFHHLLAVCLTPSWCWASDKQPPPPGGGADQSSIEQPAQKAFCTWRGWELRCTSASLLFVLVLKWGCTVESHRLHFHSEQMDPLTSKDSPGLHLIKDPF